MLLHEQSSFDSLLYFSLPRPPFLRVLASTNVSVFFVCSRLFNINGNGSNVHTQFMNAFECGVLWHSEIKEKKTCTLWTQHCVDDFLRSFSLSLECYVSMLVAQVEMVLKYYIAVIHWSLFESSSQPSAKWATSAWSWGVGYVCVRDFWLSTSCYLNTNWMNGGWNCWTNLHTFVVIVVALIPLFYGTTCNIPKKRTHTHTRTARGQTCKER